MKLEPAIIAGGAALITMLSFEFGRFGAISAAYSAGKISNGICGGTL